MHGARGDSNDIVYFSESFVLQVHGSGTGSTNIIVCFVPEFFAFGPIHRSKYQTLEPVKNSHLMDN